MKSDNKREEKSLDAEKIFCGCVVAYVSTARDVNKI